MSGGHGIGGARGGGGGGVSSLKDLNKIGYFYSK